MKEILIAGNTSKGFVSYFDKYLDYDRIICLKGGSGVGKSTLMRQALAQGKDEIDNILVMPCSSDYSSLDMLVLPGRSVVIVDATAPHILEPPAYGAKGEIFNLGEFLDKKYLRKRRKQIISAIDNKAQEYTKLYGYLNVAAAISHSGGHCKHDDTIEESKSIVGKVISQYLQYAHSARDKIIAFGEYLDIDGIKTNADKWVGTRKVVAIKCGWQCQRQEIMKGLVRYLEGLGMYYQRYYSILHPDTLVAIGLDDMVITTLAISAENTISSDFCGVNDDVQGDISRYVGLAAQSLDRARFIHQEIESAYFAAMDFDKLDKAKKLLFQDIFG